jgi:ATP-dependent Clp protease ATP-binding subunit ClpX
MSNSGSICCVCFKGSKHLKSNGEKRILAQIESKFICEECAYKANIQIELKMQEMFGNYQNGKYKYEIKKFRRFIDNYVVGQEEAKRAIAVQLEHQYSRIKHPNNDYPNGTLLFIGPTGSGKTLVAETAARYRGQISIIVDITKYTSAGYVGSNVEDIVREVFIATDGDKDKAEKAIVILDEIDKIACNENVNGQDVNGKGVQQALLKILDGSDVTFNKNHTEKEMLNTKNMLFVCSGAFSGLEKIVAKRLRTASNGEMGFGADVRRRDSVDQYDLLCQVILICV